MHPLTKLIASEMKPALGVTEPGAIAYASALAKSYVSGDLVSLKLNLSSGIYKNAFSCGIPNTNQTGILYAAALGAAIAQPETELEMLNLTKPHHRSQAEEWLRDEKIEANVAMISSRIYIEAIATGREDTCSVIIKDRHTHVEEIKLNGDIILWNKSAGQEEEKETEEIDPQVDIHNYSIKDILDYVNNIPLEEIEFLEKAYEINLELFDLSINSPRTVFASSLQEMNNCQIISDDEIKTAQLLCNATIEGRVIGLEKPAMSIAGSGAHGIICTMPLYAVVKVNALPNEALLRATALSYLITLYIKGYSGLLSAFCGCGIASGTAVACAIAYLKKADEKQINLVINNMSAGITGMICDGGNQGCTMKGIVALDAAFRAVNFALKNVSIGADHGIVGSGPEETLRRMGLVASPGMESTEKTIVEIMGRRI